LPLEARRRCACHTIARNIADISGTSEISSHGCVPTVASWTMPMPVARTTIPRITDVAFALMTRKP